MQVGGCRVDFEFAKKRPQRLGFFAAMPVHEGAPLHATWRIKVEELEPPQPSLESGVARFAGMSLRVDDPLLRTATLGLDFSLRRKELDLLLSGALHLLLRREGRLDIHAAAVCPHGTERAALILGPKGIGKTSLSMSVVALGWSLISDDQLLAWTESDGIQVGSLRASNFLMPDTVNRLPRNQPEGRFVPSIQKTVFTPEELFPGQHRVLGSATSLVFLERLKDGSASKLERIRAVDAFQRLLKHCAFLSLDPSAKPCLLVARGLADLPAFVLHAGRDVLDSATADVLLRQTMGL